MPSESGYRNGETQDQQRCSAHHVVGKWFDDQQEDSVEAQPTQSSEAGMRRQAFPNGTFSQQSSQSMALMVEFITKERRQLEDWMYKMEKQQQQEADAAAQRAQDIQKVLSSQTDQFQSMLDTAFQHHQSWLSGHLGKVDSSKAQNELLLTGLVTPTEVVPREHPEAGKSIEEETAQSPDKGSGEIKRTTNTSQSTVETQRSSLQLYVKDMRGLEENRSLFNYLMDRFHLRNACARRGKVQSAVVKLVDSRCFTLLSAFLVFANAVWIGLVTEMEMRDLWQTQQMPEWQVKIRETLTHTFTVAFTVEVALKLFAHRIYFFMSEEWRWNLFDLLLVATSLILDFNDGVKLIFLRSLRIMRILRVAKFLRYWRVFRPVQLLVSAMMGKETNEMLICSVLFLVCIIYVWGISIMQVAYPNLEIENYDEALKADLQGFYGSVGGTMLTLFQAITFGQPWEMLVAPLRKVHPGLFYMFCSYILMITAGTANLISAVMLESTWSTARRDRDIAVHEHLDDIAAFAKELRYLYAGEVGELLGDEPMDFVMFKRFLSHPDVRIFLASRGIDTDEAKNLFEILDPVDGTVGTVHLDDFVFGCQKLRGHAKQFDLAMLSDGLGSIQSKLRTLLDRNKSAVYEMRDGTNRLVKQLHQAVDAMNSLSADIYVTKGVARTEACTEARTEAHTNV